MNPLIQKILEQLSKSQQELLIYAARECICQHVEYEPGKYIGYDACYNRKLIPELEDGLWSIGKINRS